MHQCECEGLTVKGSSCFILNNGARKPDDCNNLIIIINNLIIMSRDPALG